MTNKPGVGFALSLIFVAMAGLVAAVYSLWAKGIPATWEYHLFSLVALSLSGVALLLPAVNVRRGGGG